MNENRFILLNTTPDSKWYSPLYVNISNVVAVWKENGKAKLLLNSSEGKDTITTLESYEEVLSLLGIKP